MGSMVKFLGWPTPAAEMAELRPDGVEYCMYQVPIITMAYLPDTKSLRASGYCCTPRAPFSMMPSLNSDFQVVRALTMTGLVHGTWPWMALAHTPGWISSEMAWSVSSLNAVCPTPWTKQPTPCALKVWQSLTHWVSEAGGLRWDWAKRVLLIHTLPEETAPTGRPGSLPPGIRLGQPRGERV